MLAFVNRNRVNYETEKTLPMAMAFWRGFVSAMPPVLLTRDHSQDIFGAVVTAMQVGLLFFTFWAGNEGITETAKQQCLEGLLWLENTFRPLASAAW